MTPRNPKITPVQLDLWSSNMSGLYNSLEGDIIRNIIKRLNRGSKDITQWQAEKLSELRLFNNDTEKLVSKVTGVAKPEIEKMFEEAGEGIVQRSEEHTSELQSRGHLVCRLLLEKKNKSIFI